MLKLKMVFLRDDVAAGRRVTGCTSAVCQSVREAAHRLRRG